MFRRRNDLLNHYALLDDNLYSKGSLVRATVEKGKLKSLKDAKFCHAITSFTGTIMLRNGVNIAY